MIQIDLKTFFETGEFGPISLGMSRNDVKSLFGAPPYFIEGPECPKKEYRCAGIWIYGGMELYFSPNNTTVVSEIIKSFHFKPWYLWGSVDEQVETVKLDLWVFEGKERTAPVPWFVPDLRFVAKNAVVQALEEAGIAYQDTGLEVLMDTD
jgi:hypothetical protein